MENIRLTPEEQRMRAKLIETAHEHTLFKGYQEFCNHCKVKLDMSIPDHRPKIGNMLGNICLYEKQQDSGRPLLSAVLVGYDNMPGDGFYSLCEIVEKKNRDKLKADITFYAEKLGQCYEFWSNEENFTKFREYV